MEIGRLATTTVVTVGPGHTLAEAARRMVDNKVGSAVVTTDDGLPGIITERDLLKAIAEGAAVQSATVAEYMTASPITASASWDVMTAARRMSEGGFRHLIVLDELGEVVGMLSLRDLVDQLIGEMGTA